MNMELIQPFINATDAVLAAILQAPAEITEVSMDENAYRRQGVAAVVNIRGEIEGRVIFDLDGETSKNMASLLAADMADGSAEAVNETVCELANQVVGNAVTTLNDAGFRFEIRPPEPFAAELGLKSTEDSEAIVLCFATHAGKVFMNISIRFHWRRDQERHFAGVA